MDTFSPYDITSALESAIKAARFTGEARYVVQTAYGYQIRKELGLAFYNKWKINADGGVDEDALNIGHMPEVPLIWD